MKRGRPSWIELEPQVIQSLDHAEWNVENGLLQNDESISLQAARDYDSLILLRWRKRECVECESSFDITTEGMLYRCGGCIG